MTRAVLSIGSNLGDRLTHLQSAVTGLGDTVRAVSGVYETEAWGGVNQDPFLNAVVIVAAPDHDGPGWLRRAHDLEQAADRVRSQRWGPRTLDVDVVSCYETRGFGETFGETEVHCHDDRLTLPHPFAHVRAFVMVPWLEIEPDARLTVDGRVRSVADLLSELGSAELAGLRLTDSVLQAGARRDWVLGA